MTVSGRAARTSPTKPSTLRASRTASTSGRPDEAAKMEDIARKNGALEIRVARDDAEATKLATARRSAFSALARVAPTTILEDVTVPRSVILGPS